MDDEKALLTTGFAHARFELVPPLLPLGFRFATASRKLGAFLAFSARAGLRMTPRPGVSERPPGLARPEAGSRQA